MTGRSFLLVLLAALGLGCASPVENGSIELDQWMHFEPGTAARVDPATRVHLGAAMEDFRAVVAGRSPIHDPTLFVGNGYQIQHVSFYPAGAMRDLLAED